MNHTALISFILGLVIEVVYVAFLTPKQLKEVLRPYDGLTKLRYYILAILVIAILTGIPGLAYTYFRIYGQSYHALQNIASITTRVSGLATTTLLVLVFTYRKKDD